MPKHKLGKGWKRGVRTVKNSHSSPRAIRLEQRKQEALDLKLDGHSFRRIGKMMHVHHSTAESYVYAAMADFNSPEKKEHARNLFLARNEENYRRATLQAAATGDVRWAAECRKLEESRAWVEGIAADKGGGDQHLHVHGADALEVGIRVTAPEWKGPADEPPRTIEHQRALPPPRPDWQSMPKPEDLPSNVTPLASLRSRKPAPEPVAEPTAPYPMRPEDLPQLTLKQRREAKEERFKAEGFGEWSDFSSPFGPRSNNPNAPSRNGKFIKRRQ